MACMEHLCGKCGHMEFNNQTRILCPKCGSDDVISHWDDQDAFDREDEEESEDTDDE
jgi:predicted  nucleic acid-binding Zn-ribbon protein